MSAGDAGAGLGAQAMADGVVTRSGAVAGRLGLRAAGIRRESYRITDRLAHHVVYGIFDRDREMDDHG
jgi:hypothetical protein